MNRKNCCCNGTFTDRNRYNELCCERCQFVCQDEPCPPPTPVCEPDLVYSGPRSIRCYPEKPKKGFWQMLFGDVMCKRRQGCVTKRPKKPKCKPVQEQLCEEPDCQPCEPVGKCKCKSSACPRRGCIPNRKSVCGCHFYFNVENCPRRRPYCQKKESVEETVKDFKYDTSEESEKENLAAPISPYSMRPSLFSTNTGRLDVTSDEGLFRPSVLRKSIVSKRRPSRISFVNLPSEEPKKENIHFGLTVTREETKYLKQKNTSLCKDKCQVDECKVDESESSESNSSSNSSEQYITLEFKKSEDKVIQHGKEAEKKVHLKVLDDYVEHPTAPHSESLNREIMPLMKKKNLEEREIGSVESEDEDEDEFLGDRQKRRSQLRSSLHPSSSSQYLDKRVNQILQKLNEIEEKISTIENKEQDRNIKIDYDGIKSTVSLHIKDANTPNKRYGGNNNSINHSANMTKKIGNTIIEIRQTQSKSCSPIRMSLPENEARPSQSFDSYDNNKQSNQKIVIKLPKFNTKTRRFIVPDDQTIQKRENVKRNFSWYDVADELKYSVADKCYCYECVLKRVQC